MSHPSPATSVTSSRYSSPTDRFIPPTSPVQNQSHAANPSKSPQAILNQKLIPRNYLSNGMKPSSATSNGIAAENAVLCRDQSSDLRPHLFNNVPVDYTHDGHDETKVRSASGSMWNGKASPDSDTLGYEELKVPRSRRLDFVDASPPSSNPGFAKPDSPTLHFEHPVLATMPRNSSIDSAISTVSAKSVQKAAGDLHNTSETNVRNLISTAGGAENLISHLLKDKNNVAAQNSQLWKLVEKQRALLLGLNKDLERVTKERDKYKKKAKECQQNIGEREKQVSQSPRTVIRDGGRGKSSTPVSEPPPTAQLFNSNHTDLGRQSPAAGVQEQHGGEAILHDSTRSGPPHPIRTPSEQDEQPSFALTVATPQSATFSKGVNSSRKAAPKPLTLVKSNEGLVTARQTSANSEHAAFDEEPERGRRRTREDDDRERELSALQAEEARSRSKKQEKLAKAAQAVQVTQAVQPAGFIDEHKVVTTSSPPLGLPLSPRPQHAQSFVSQMQPQTITSLGERMLAGSLKSPGLPVSPRPMHHPGVGANSLPLSPRATINNPLSPRAPKQPLPLPTNPAAPIDAAMLQSSHQRTFPGAQTSPQAEVDRLHVHRPATTDAPSIYRGLMAGTYPNLLLPPNALPSILVKVASSRSKPSRHSMLGFMVHDDSTIFSLSIISRSSNSELWRIDKVPSALPQLEQQLKPRCAELPKLPDRKLFAGHSPALADTRRKAIDDYFEELLDIPIDEPAALIICNFLSTDVIDPDVQVSQPAPAQTLSPTSKAGKATKMGYLTKKGKNFGGWKTRYFVLEGSELRYYESAGGAHLGTIRLQSSQIGKQKQDEHPGEDQDGQFRHAFLIQEPKRKDSTTYIRHVLCAESDVERDEWVSTLMEYSEVVSHGAQLQADHELHSKRSASAIRDRNMNKDLHSNSPTPTVSSSNADSPAQEHSTRDGKGQTSTISGPMNGSVITDASSWGHKTPPPQSTAKDLKDKGSKMGNIFGFKKSDGLQVAGSDSKAVKPRVLRHNGYVRPVFGLPLAEAVEFCAPFNDVDIEVPAVVFRCIEYLRYQDAAQEEGLFRLSGSNTTVRTLKERFNAEGDVDLVAEGQYLDIHAVASLFKSYLRELPSTLLTRELHIEFVKVLELSGNSEKIAAFNVLVHRLPHVNYVLLKMLSHFLLEVTLSADKNKMSVRNMGIVFSPTLNIPTPVFNLFLTEFSAIFESDANQMADIRTTEIAAQSLAPTDIRSPRHQMFSDVPTPAYHQTSFPGLPTHPHDKHKTTPGLDVGNMGFVPVQPSYESGHYVSQVAAARSNSERGRGPVQAQVQTQAQDRGAFNSLNSLLAPDTAPATKAQRRESAMIHSSALSQ